MLFVSALQLAFQGEARRPCPSTAQTGRIRGIVADDEGRSTLAGTYWRKCHGYAAAGAARIRARAGAVYLEIRVFAPLGSTEEMCSGALPELVTVTL